MKSKSITMLLATCFMFLIFAQPASAQHQRTMKVNPGEVTIIQGLGAIIKIEDNGLNVMMVPDKNQRSKEYKNVDIATNDIIIMCNGKKVKTIKDLDAVLETIKAGEEVSFGIKRGKEMILASFPKNDGGAGGNMMMMTMNVDEGGNSETSIMKDGVELKDVIMIPAGLILKDVDNKTTIIAVLPELLSSVKGEKPQDGDVIISFNGKESLSSKDIKKSYGKVKTDEMISMSFMRDNKKFEITFKKQAPGGNEVIIRK